MFGLENWSAFWWILLLLVVLIATYLYMIWPYNYHKNMGIPGPPPVPMFGVKAEWGKKPMGEVHVDLIRQYGKVVGLYTGWDIDLIVADVDMLKEVLIKNFDSFCDKRKFFDTGIFKHGLLAKDGAEWKRQRTQLTPYFTAGTLKMSTVSMNRILDNFIELLSTKCQQKQMFEAKRSVDYFTMDVICQTAFGVEVNSVKQPDLELLKLAKEFVALNNTTNIIFMLKIFTPTLSKIVQFFSSLRPNRYFEELVRKIVQQRRESPQDSPDFIQILLKAEEARKRSGDTKMGLTEDEIVANGVLFMFGGFDTTAGGLALFLYNLTVHDQCQQKVYEEIQEVIGDEKPTYEQIQRLSYLDMCFDESLRVLPVAQITDRACVKDTVINGVLFKKGTHVQIPIWYLHKHPEIWPDPERFVPERFSAENKKTRDPLFHIPFGLGPRHCIGMRLAEFEIKIAVVRILQKFKLLRNEKTQVPLELDHTSFTTKSKDGIWISLEERHPGND